MSSPQQTKVPPPTFVTTTSFPQTLHLYFSFIFSTAIYFIWIGLIINLFSPGCFVFIKSVPPIFALPKSEGCARKKKNNSRHMVYQFPGFPRQPKTKLAEIGQEKIDDYMSIYLRRPLEKSNISKRNNQHECQNTNRYQINIFVYHDFLKLIIYPYSSSIYFLKHPFEKTTTLGSLQNISRTGTSELIFDIMLKYEVNK